VSWVDVYKSLTYLVDEFKHKPPSSNFSRWRTEEFHLLKEATSFLSDAASASERLWYIDHRQHHATLCRICNKNLLSWINKERDYRATCGKCNGKLPATAAKRKATMLERYGVESYTQHDQFNDKRISTNQQQYGTDWGLQCPHIQDKRKSTMMERYGAENTLQSPVLKQKVINTLQQKYNVKHNSQTTHWRESVRQTFLENLGVEHNTQLQIDPVSLIKLNDRNYLKSKHITEQIPLHVIAKELQVNQTTVANYFRKHDITIQRFPKSYGERTLSEFIQQLGIIVINGDRSIIQPYELDIVLPEHKIAIEYCGLFWHSETCGKDKRYHEMKMKLANAAGYRLLTIYEDEWVKRTNQVKNKIKHMLGMSVDKVYARKCTVELVDNKQEFFDKHHIQGSGPGSITFQLVVNERPCAMMTFIQCKNQSFYLNRYATSMSVVGGFSKLLKHFEKNIKWSKIISFADLRWSDGNLYRQCGFELDGIIPPDYYYSPNGVDRYHKSNYRHAQLPKRLANYDPTKTEWENCDVNGIHRIWDCGKMRFVRYA